MLTNGASVFSTNEPKPRVKLVVMPRILVAIEQKHTTSINTRQSSFPMSSPKAHSSLPMSSPKVFKLARSSFIDADKSMSR